MSPDGNDAADGSASAPWKTIQYAANRVIPGDTILVRGGTYPEEVLMKTSGTEAAPIRFMAYPGETAILDGSSPVSASWTQCPSAAACLNAPNYAQIYYAPFAGDFFGSHLLEGDQLLHPSQWPDQPHAFYKEQSQYFAKPIVPTATKTSIRDPDNLAAIDDLAGAYIGVWTSNNLMVRRKVNSYDLETRTVSFDLVDTLRSTEDYTLYNHASFLSKPGFYVIDPDAARIYVIPHSNIQNVRFSERKVGFSLAGKSYVTIDGFHIRGFAGSLTWTGVAVLNKSYQPAAGIVVQNLKVYGNMAADRRGAIFLGACTDCKAEGNWVGTNLNRGIHVISGTRVLVKNNFITTNYHTGIFFQIQADSIIDGNTIKDNEGIHANGISIYQQSTNNQIVNNRIINAKFGITLQDSNGTRVERNLIKDNYSTDSSRLLVIYGGATHANDTVVRFNTVINSGQHAALFTGRDNIGVIMENNVLDGFITDNPTSFLLQNNLFLGLSWQQSEGTLGSTQRLFPGTLADLFVDPAGDDFRLKTGLNIGGINPCAMATDSTAVGALGCGE